MESDVEFRETAILRGAITIVEAAHGEAPRLQVQAAAQAHLHRGREEDAHIRVQVADAATAAGNEATVVPRQRARDELPIPGRLRAEHATPPGYGSRAIGEA